MKAWQRKIREKEAQKDPRPVVGLENATVVEISYEKAKELILKYEWLGNMGTTERSFGLILDGELAGVCLFWENRRNRHGKIGLRRRMGAVRRHAMPWGVLSLGPSARRKPSHQRGLQADGEQCQNDEERESVSARVYICRVFGHRRRGNWNRLPSLQLVVLRKNFRHDDVP